jgi:sarcosine oxidase delta subunit
LRKTYFSELIHGHCTPKNQETAKCKEIEMKRSSKPANFSRNPFMLWTGLALKTGEMMVASAQVIQHRTGRIVTAGPIPSSRDQREFTLMGQEKIEAAAESAQAMATRMARLNQQISTLAFQQILAGTTGMMALATSSTLAQSHRRQTRLMRDTVSKSVSAASELADTVARVADHGLKPIHSRAKANAKRLAKLKR